MPQGFKTVGGRVLVWALGGALGTALATARAEEAPQWDVRVQGLHSDPSTQGPLALARALEPGLVPASPDSVSTEVEARHTLRFRVGSQPVAVGLNGAARHQHARGGGSHTEAWLNELHAGTDVGAWSFTAGKRVLGWDVGYGFRPNDMVQQELRRSLISVTPEGRPLLMAETFGADTAGALVWVNPQHLNTPAAKAGGGQESALAARAYGRAGSADWHAFARLGRHTRASVGAAVAWVATDELELHASARRLQRHESWRSATPLPGTLSLVSPWSVQTQGASSQWLIGLNWTGEQQQGVLLEIWHDGTVLPNAEWRRWTAHNLALVGSPAPALARAGNLAWQATPFSQANVRQDNVFLRLSWQPGAWQMTVDALYHPADRGVVSTAALTWQGNHWKLGASLRHLGGAPQSVVAQLPQRRQWVLTAQWTH